MFRHVGGSVLKSRASPVFEKKRPGSCSMRGTPLTHMPRIVSAHLHEQVPRIAERKLHPGDQPRLCVEPRQVRSPVALPTRLPGRLLRMGFEKPPVVLHPADLDTADGQERERVTRRDKAGLLEPVDDLLREGHVGALVPRGVGEDRDADIEGRVPCHERLEAVPAATVVQVKVAPVPAHRHSQPVPAVVGCGLHLDEQGFGQKLPVGLALSQHEAEERAHVVRGGIDATCRGHGRDDGHWLTPHLVPDRPVWCAADDVGIQRGPGHSQGRQHLFLDVVRVALPRGFLQDKSCKIDPEVGVPVALSDPEHQPRVLDACHVFFEGRLCRVIIVPDRRLVCETRGVREKMAQRDPFLRPFFKDALDPETRQVLIDGRVEIQDPVPHSSEHADPGKGLRHGLDAEHRVAVHGHLSGIVGKPETCLPDRAVRIDQREGKARNPLPAHRLPGQLLDLPDDLAVCVGYSRPPHLARSDDGRRADAPSEEEHRERAADEDSHVTSTPARRFCALELAARRLKSASPLQVAALQLTAWAVVQYSFSHEAVHSERWEDRPHASRGRRGRLRRHLSSGPSAHH